MAYDTPRTQLSIGAAEKGIVLFSVLGLAVSWAVPYVLSTQSIQTIAGLPATVVYILGLYGAFVLVWTTFIARHWRPGSADDQPSEGAR